MATDCLFKITIQLEKPFDKNGILTTHINIPCGKCGRCLERRKMEWSFRMMEELRESKTAYFVTLTYAPETIPINKWGQKTLVPTRQKDIEIKLIEEGRKRNTKKWRDKLVDRSLEGFFKRLRQNHKRVIPIEWLINGLNKTDKIRFYGAGEYGQEKFRPHYHAVIFNTSQKAIEKSWTLGDTHIVKANEATINYLMKYLDKSLGQDKPKNKEPEFNTMSEGIGESYIKRMKKWHKENQDVLYVTHPTGIRIPMPKYFRHKIFTEDERQDQVLLVTEVIEEARQEAIKKLGGSIHKYNKVQNALKKETKKRFLKKIKKRFVD